MFLSSPSSSAACAGLSDYEGTPFPTVNRRLCRADLGRKVIHVTPVPAALMKNKQYYEIIIGRMVRQYCSKPNRLHQNEVITDWPEPM
jgi:hypothetical protein